MNQNLAILHYLYTLEAFGESFHLPITLQERQASKEEKTLGWSGTNARLGLITKNPTLNQEGNFTPKKSSIMLENILENFFKLSKDECSIFSFYKSDELQEHHPEELQTHKQILWRQILQNPATIFVIFGEEIAQLMFGKTLQNGAKINFKNKVFIITHSLYTLLKIPMLKKETLQHLKIAKELL